MSYLIGMEGPTGSPSADDENLGFRLALHGAPVEFACIPRTEVARVALDAQRLIEHERVFMLLNFYGGPASNAVAALANQHETPYLFPHTFLLPSWAGPWVFTSLPPYKAELAVMKAYLADRGIRRVAVLQADNVYGRLYDEALGTLPGTRVASHKPDSLVDEVRALRALEPEAIVLALYPLQASKAMQAIATLDWKGVRIISAGPLTDEQFLHAGSRHAEGLIGFCYFPDPSCSPLEGVAAYRAAMHKHHPGHPLNRFSLYGWVYGQLTLEGLRRAGPSATRREFIEALESIHDWDSGGIMPPVSFSQKQHHAQHAGMICEMRNGRLQPLTDWLLPVGV